MRCRFSTSTDVRKRSRPQGPAVAVEEIEPRATAECLAHVAAIGWLTEALYCHPVELPDVPEVGVAHRGVADRVVRRVELVREDGVADAGEGVGPAQALRHRVEVLSSGRRSSPCLQQGAQDLAQVVVEAVLPPRVAPFTEDLLPEAAELEGVQVGASRARREGGHEVAERRKS